MSTMTAASPGIEPGLSEQHVLWTLASRVYGIIAHEEDAAHVGPEGHHTSARLRGGLTKREIALRDWGTAYGLALGLALCDKPPADPSASLHDYHTLAVAVADTADGRYGGPIPPRPSHGDVIDRVITAFDDPGTNGLSAVSEPALVELCEALTTLTETYGVPWDEQLSVEPESVASSNGSVPLPLEDIAAIDRVLQGHLLDMGFGENFSLEEFLGIGARPSPTAFEALGDQLAVIARVLKALESHEYPLDRESRELLADLIQEAEKDAAQPDDSLDKVFTDARLEWLRLAQGVVSRCADEHARETMTEGGDA